MLHLRHGLKGARTCLRERHFHVSALRRRSHETIVVPCASNGSISLDIYAPSQRPPETEQTKVAIFLPRGPIYKDEASDAANIALLHSTLPCHVVQIKYRCSSLHQFPTPVHDVAAGFDWIVSNLLPKRSILRPNRSEHVGKLAVCGELIGGQLATMLALTECRINEPGIVSAAVNNPIADWVSLDENGLTLEDRMKDASGLTIQALLKQRTQLFRKTEHYHDPFASPVLFFRTSGYEVGEDEELPPADEMDELALLAREEYMREQQPVRPLLDITNPETLENIRVKKRKSSRRYPSKALGLRLPRFAITAGEESPILGQASELTHLLEQSFERQNKLKMSSETAADMVHFEQHPGLGLWDESKAGRDRMLQVAKWMGDALGH